MSKNPYNSEKNDFTLLAAEQTIFDAEIKPRLPLIVWFTALNRKRTSEAGFSWEQKIENVKLLQINFLQSSHELPRLSPKPISKIWSLES
jgi:hypothetical protein